MARWHWIVSTPSPRIVASLVKSLSKGGNESPHFNYSYVGCRLYDIASSVNLET